MRSKRLSFLPLIVALALAVANLPIANLRAADQVTLTLAVQDNTRDIFEGQLLKEFEAANPTIKVQLVNDTSGGIQDVANAGLDAHLTAVGKLVSIADVIPVNSNRVSVEATLAGYFLDMAPLVASDNSINVDDFYPTIWQSFQWNRGIWALPTAADVQILIYDPAAFDALNMAYPDPKWSLDDLANAARKLIEKNAKGEITRAGIVLQQSNFDALILRSLLKEGLFDSTTFPNAPVLTQPELVSMVDSYVQLTKDGAIGRGGGNNAPMTVQSVLQLVVPRNDNTKRAGVLLPGGKAGLNVQGYSISGGTQHPNEAYILAKWLTTRAEVSNRFVASPARKSLAGQTGQNQGPRLNLTADIQKLIDSAVQNGIPTSELRYTNRVASAIQTLLQKGGDSKAALADAEAKAIADLKAAQDKRSSTNVTVATPVPEGPLADGKIAIKFGFSSFVSPLPNQDKWDKLIADFIASDPQVGRINFETSGRAQFALDAASKTFDCFYLSSNVVPSAKLELLLPLDPLMSADTKFDKTDIVGNVMAQLQRDNKTWAFPITVQPTILRYDAKRFANAGASQPTEGWTVSDFNNALKLLKVDPADPAPFIPGNTGGTHLLILIAAYGGMPLDYRTDPVTINYTDPKTLDAIRQVLDLAKKGYIQYDTLGSLNFGFGGGGGGANNSASILNAILNAFTFQGLRGGGGGNGGGGNGGGANTNNATYTPIPYPQGNEVAAVSYSIAAGYISATSKAPEACYRWLSVISKHPELFSAMPAFRSMINDTNVTATQNPAVTALYNQVDKLLKDSKTISIPALNDVGNNPSTFVVQYWLYKAFDSYVQKDGDLEAGLKDAETKGKGFVECAATVPPLDASTQQGARDFLRAFAGCAAKVDPELKPLLGLIG